MLKLIPGSVNNELGASVAGKVELVRPFRGVSAAERQRLRRERLIEAGLELFGTKGIASVSVGEICAEAGLTKRYFYESFASLAELVDAVVERAVARFTAAVLPEIISHGWREPGPIVRAGMTALHDDPRLTRLLVVETHSGALTRYRHELINRAVDIWLQADADTTEDPVELENRRLLAYAYAGAAGEVAMASVDGHLDLTADQVTGRLVMLFQRITGGAHC